MNCPEQELDDFSFHPLGKETNHFSIKIITEQSIRTPTTSILNSIHGSIVEKASQLPANRPAQRPSQLPNAPHQPPVLPTAQRAQPTAQSTFPPTPTTPITTCLPPPSTSPSNSPKCQANSAPDARPRSRRLLRLYSRKNQLGSRRLPLPPPASPCPYNARTRRTLPGLHSLGATRRHLHGNHPSPRPLPLAACPHQRPSPH